MKHDVKLVFFNLLCNRNYILKMSTEIFFLRHALSQVNYQLPTDQWELTKLGLEQAEKLSVLFTKNQFSEIYTSPYKRCIQTITPYCQRAKLSYVKVEDLRERTVTPYYTESYHEIFLRSWKERDYSIPHAESANQALDRVKSTLLNLAKKHQNQRILISSHGQLLGLLLNNLEPRFGFYDQKKIRNPDLKVFKISGSSISLIEYDPELRQKLSYISFKNQ